MEYHCIRYRNCFAWILLSLVVNVYCVYVFGTHLRTVICYCKPAQCHTNYSNPSESANHTKYAYAGLLYVGDRAAFLKYLILAETWCYQLKFIVKTTYDVFVYSHVNLTALLIEFNQTTLLDLGCKAVIFSDFNFIEEKAQYKDLFTSMPRIFDESILETELLSLYQYDCIIHMDFDMIIQKNLDSLFIHSPHRMYGVSDTTAMLNNGLIVLTPNKDDYEKLKKFWKNAFWGCDGVNNYNPNRRPYLYLFGVCDQVYNAGPQGVLPAYFYQHGEYVQLADIYNFYISPANQQWNMPLEDIYAFHVICCKGVNSFYNLDLGVLKPFKPLDNLCLLLSSYLNQLKSAAQEQAQHMHRTLKPPQFPDFSEKKNGYWVRSNLAAKADMKTYCSNLHCSF